MEKALIEFDSGELEIVSLSTLRKFDAAASLPVECICDWKSTGKKKATSYAVKVLRLGSTYSLHLFFVSRWNCKNVEIEYSLVHRCRALRYKLRSYWPHWRDGPPSQRSAIAKGRHRKKTNYLTGLEGK